MKNLSLHKHGRNIDRAFLFSTLQKPNTILLESSRQDEQNKKNLLFHSPVEILSTNNLDDIPNIFLTIEEHLKNKKWIAGYIGYECGYHFEKIICGLFNPTSLPLLWFGVYDSPCNVETTTLNAGTTNLKSEIKNPTLMIDDHFYYKKIEHLKEYITNGDTYQVNFTDRFEFDFNGDARDLYFALRQKQHVPFGAFINTGDSQMLSFSPELFFRRNENSMTTTPMKGTCKRGKNLEDDKQLSAWLQADEKNRSENLMIVDLLRNDIGRICETGSVTVSDMYAIEKYETVLQMTSTVNGTLKNGIGYYDIFKSLFPCGSVTGAPKIRTMQIIHELEQHQRGVYCGAIGFISPENEAVFNVAIRTIELHNAKGTMGVGSGIVFDSDAENELEECRLKADFLLKEQPDFQLLETILWKNGFTFLEQHLERMKNSADYFFVRFEKEKILDALTLSERSFDSHKEYRVRLLLSKYGESFVEAKEIIAANSLEIASSKRHPSTPLRMTNAVSCNDNAEVNYIIKIASERTDSVNKFFFHKTTHRDLYNRYWLKAQQENIADYMFLNERDEITEGTITNFFIEKSGKFFTPPLSCGLLAGIYRHEVLRTNPNASEKILNIEDVRSADALYICNSVRGWQKVTLSE